MMEATVTPDVWMEMNATGNMSGNVTIVEEEPWRQKLDFINTILLTITTVVFMLGLGSDICVKELWEHAKKPVGAVIGMVGQFIVLPFVGFCLSLLFKLTPYEALGVLMISCCPGGTFSNFFTYWVNGDLALSILMTACSSIIAFGGMPFNLWLYSQYWVGDDGHDLVLPYKNIITSLIFISIPAVVGIIIRHFSPKIASIITKTTGILGWLGVLAGGSIWLILYYRSFIVATPLIYLAAILLPIIGFFLAYGLARVTCQGPILARTVGIETGCQNMPVALSIVLLSYSDPELKAKIMLFPTLYGILLIVQATVYIGTYLLGKFIWNKYKGTQDLPETHTAKVEKGSKAEKTRFV